MGATIRMEASIGKEATILEQHYIGGGGGGKYYGRHAGI